MDLLITPGFILHGTHSLAGDKSLSHRAALLAGMAHGESQIDNFLVAGVTEAMLRALTALGVPWELAGSRLSVRSPGLQGWQPPVRAIDCGNSATTIRLLAGALAAAGIPAVLDGTPSLQRRPMRRIIDPLGRMGAVIHSPTGGAPLALQGRGRDLHGITYTLPVASAQLKSCLLLAGLAARGETLLSEPAPSRDHTERMLRSLGVEVFSMLEMAGDHPHYTTRLIPPGRLELPPMNIRLAGDISAAAFLIVAALITPGSDIVLQNVGLNPTRTGLLDALLAMDAQIEITPGGEQHGEPVGDLRVRASQLKGTSVAGELVVRMIDEFPAFAVAAAFADGVTRVCDAEELRHKESDRILAMCSELQALGVQAEELPDGFRIHGGRPTGGEVQAHNDHRLAMSLALVGLAARQPVVVHGAEIIAESFPDFVTVLQGLGARLQTGTAP